MNQFELLWDYQQADVEVDKVKKDIARSPQRLKLLKLRDNIKEQQNFLKTLESEVIAMLDRIDVLQDAIGIHEDQLKQLQTKVQEQPPANSQQAREYVQETQKIINSLGDFDQETRRIRKDAADRDKKQRDIKRLAVKIKTEFDTIRDEYNMEFEQKSEELRRLQSIVDEKAKAIDKEAMDEYNAVKQHSVPPMAKLVNDRCGGCNMSFPSSVLHAIKSGKKVECETCGRMIIL
ncbi:MAG: hypothetical protein GX123_07935 [Clostridiales bacterium]|jgi:predicted  nucleic acid-binding Zn-ribbon protein|nr:C4-type zinc ribbon domain-containing protein [Eubacteriales bacterium]NLO15948.1 hypothetical protein [Clostridiales bacterium]